MRSLFEQRQIKQNSFAQYFEQNVTRISSLDTLIRLKIDQRVFKKAFTFIKGSPAVLSGGTGEFDNGNGRLSLAEIDRAVTHFYPQFGTNKKAIMRAYKEADSSGVRNCKNS